MGGKPADPPRAFYAVGFIVLAATAGMLVLSIDDGSPLGAIAGCLFAAVGSFGLQRWLRRIQARPPQGPASVEAARTGLKPTPGPNATRSAGILERWRRRR